MKHLLFILCIVGCMTGCGGNDVEVWRLRTQHYNDSLNISALRITVDTVEKQFGDAQEKYDSLYKEVEPVLPFEGQVVEYRGRVMTWHNGEWYVGCTYPGCALKAHKEAAERIP